MTRLLLCVMLSWSSAGLVACRASLPEPRLPLVATPTDSRPTAPDVEPMAPPAFPTVRGMTRPGGTLWYVADHRLSPLVVRVQTRRGDDGAYPTGLVDLTTTVLAETLDDRLGRGRASSGVNAHGAYLEVRSSNEELPATLEALASVLDGPPPDAETIDPIRSRVLELLENANEDPLSASRVAALDEIKGREADIDEGMRQWRSVFRGYDVDVVDACRRERFAADDRVVIVAGRIEVPRMLEAFESHFGGEREAMARKEAPPFAERTPEHAALSRPMSLPQAYVVFARPAPPPTAEEVDDHLVGQTVLGGTFGSRLNGSLRETHSYTYGAHAYLGASEGVDVLYIQSAFHPPDVEDAVRDLFAQLRSVRSDPFSEREITAARTRIWSHLAARLEGNGLAGVLAQAWNMGLAPMTLEQRYHALEELTGDQLLAVARERFDPHRGILVITGDFREIGGLYVERTSAGFRLRD